jgi:hypothetical protein
MKIHHLSVDEALQSLHSSPTGLSGPEAQRRLREFGPNRVEPARTTPPWPSGPRSPSQKPCKNRLAPPRSA